MNTIDSIYGLSLPDAEAIERREARIAKVKDGMIARGIYLNVSLRKSVEVAPVKQAPKLRKVI